MKAASLFLCWAISAAVFALPPVRPVLPPVGHGDAESATNVPFAAWQEYAGKFRVSLTCRTTPTNNVQMAFGTDADGDGVLSLEESDLLVGWDCGAWFVQSGFDGGRVESAGGADGAQTLSYEASLDPRTGAPVSAAAVVDGAAAFPGVDAAWLHRGGWNMLRLTGRGLAVSGESTEVRVLPDAISIFVR